MNPFFARRMMMQEKESKKKIYIYNGYIGTDSTANSEPITNSLLPNAVCTSAIFIRSGSLFNFSATAVNQALRRYDIEGKYYQTGYSWKNIRISSDSYIRFLANSGIESFECLTVLDENGNVDEYEIIDRR